jgi:hypothetical protein
MKHLYILLASTLIAIQTNTAFAQESTSFSTYKGWDISYRENSDGDPFQCSGFTQYEGGMGIFIGFERFTNGDGMFMNLAHKSWKSIEDGKEYEIKIEFPRRSPWTLKADGYTTSSGYFGVGMDYVFDDDVAEFISDFKKTTGMDISVQGNKIGSFTLKGSMGMMNEVARCFKQRVVEPSKDPFNSSSSSSSDPFDL